MSTPSAAARPPPSWSPCSRRSPGGPSPARPAARTAPRDLPLGVAGPASAAAQVEQRLERREGAFEIHRCATVPLCRRRTAAHRSIEDRTVYGAIGVTAQGTERLTASAARPFVAQQLRPLRHDCVPPP